jgi:hypothetical protein
MSDLNELKDEIKNLKENDLTHIKAEITEIKTDLKWVKRIQWYAITTSLGSLVGIALTLITLLLKK